MFVQAGSAETHAGQVAVDANAFKIPDEVPIDDGMEPVKLFAYKSRFSTVVCEKAKNKVKRTTYLKLKMFL